MTTFPDSLEAAAAPPAARVPGGHGRPASQDNGSAMSAQAAVENFMTAFYRGDAAATRDTITDDFTLIGPFAAAHSADEFFEVARGLLTIVRGHRILRCTADGDNVAVLYEIALQGPDDQGWLTAGGWFTVAGGRLSSGQLIYNNAAFDAIVNPS